MAVIQPYRRRNKTVPVEYKNATVITLQPLETLVFEAVTIN